MAKLYRGYKIEHEFNHYLVKAPDGSSWTEDTVEDAKESIDEELLDNQQSAN